MASKADDACRFIALAVSRKILMMLSINPSPHPNAVVGTSTAISLAEVTGMDSSKYSGSRTFFCIGWCSLSGSQFGIKGSSFDKSVHNSEKAHQVAGLTLTPKHN